MKKVMVLMTVVMMVVLGMVTIASANDDPIWENVYQWWKDTNSEEYQMFLNTEYNYNGFVKNNIAYYASSNCSLWCDEFHTIEEIKQYFDEASEKVGITDFETKVNCIGLDGTGRHVMELTLNTTVDLRKAKDAGFDVFEEPVFGMKLICYDRMYVTD